jgi:hypothetical protein
MVGEVFGSAIMDIGIWNFVIGIFLIRALVAKLPTSRSQLPTLC